MAQDPAYRDQVIPPTKPVLAVEVGVGSGWYSIWSRCQIRVFSLINSAAVAKRMKWARISASRRTTW